MNVGHGVKIVRKQRGLTQKQLAKMIGLTQTSICSIEKGNKSPSQRNTKLIADALGTTPAHFSLISFCESDVSESNLPKFKLLKGVYDSLIRDLFQTNDSTN